MVRDWLTLDPLLCCNFVHMFGSHMDRSERKTSIHTPTPRLEERSSRSLLNGPLYCIISALPPVVTGLDICISLYAVLGCRQWTWCTVQYWALAVQTNCWSSEFSSPLYSRQWTLHSFFVGSHCEVLLLLLLQWSNIISSSELSACNLRLANKEISKWWYWCFGSIFNRPDEIRNKLRLIIEYYLNSIIFCKSILITIFLRQQYQQ